MRRQRRHLGRAVRVLGRLAAGQRIADRAVHEQVRIAPDRRGEMRVGVQRQAEVPGILRAVHRQRLRAQQHRLDQAGLGTVADLLQQRGEIGRRHLAGRRQLQRETRAGTRAGPRTWPPAAAHGRGTAPGYRACRGTAPPARSPRSCTPRSACAHRCACSAPSCSTSPVCRQLELDLGRLELDRAAPPPRLGQDLVQLVQVLQLRQHVGQFLRAHRHPARRSPARRAV